MSDAHPSIATSAMSPVRMALGKLVLAPIIAAYKCHLIHASFIRSCICRIAYLGRREKEVYKLGAAYAKDHLPKMIRPDALKRIVWHKSRGDVVVIVSASLHFYLRDWCRLQGLELLCTEVTGLGGILTGGFSPSDCTGEEKSRRVREKYDLNSYSTIYAYGDTQDDVPLLNLAHKKYFRWSETSDINTVIAAIQSARRDPDSPQRLKEIDLEDRSLVRLIAEQNAMDQAYGDGVFARKVT